MDIVRIVGCGDAFGSAGLHATCFHLASKGCNTLIDIGAGSLPNLKSMSIDLNLIDNIVLSHFHGDHYGGLPNFLLDAVFIQNRTRQLNIIGPPGVQDQVWQLQEAMYGGTSSIDYGFPVQFIEYRSGHQLTIGDLRISVVPVVHSEPSKPHAIRIDLNHKSLVYTGDTEWTDDLLSLTKGSDLLITECFGWSGPLKFHLSYDEIISKLDELGAARVCLTHLGPDALAHKHEMGLTVLEPNMKIEL